MALLTNGNRDLRRDRIWTWTLPAWVTELPDGRVVNICPSAGACAPLCYARKGTYNFGPVRAAHARNLLRILDDLAGWEAEMTAELARPKFAGTHVRIHDAGDFLSDDYLVAWLRIIRASPATTFYAYTKEVARFRALVEPDPPANFHWIYSFGGRQDDAINDTDRQCDVFPTAQLLADAGYTDQAASDLDAIYGPSKVGIVVNNHPGAVARLAGRSLGEVQRDRHRARKSTAPA
jgi:hypothetical protein